MVLFHSCFPLHFQISLLKCHTELTIHILLLPQECCLLYTLTLYFQLSVDQPVWLVSQLSSASLVVTQLSWSVFRRPENACARAVDVRKTYVRVYLYVNRIKRSPCSNS